MRPFVRGVYSKHTCQIGKSIGMDSLEVIRDSFHRDVPAAIVASGNGGVAFDAVERAAVEELFEPFAVGSGGTVGGEGNVD